MFTSRQFKLTAEKLQCELACVQAVAEVESAGSAYDIHGRVKILFEAHIFWKLLKKKGIDPINVQTGNEDILQPIWNMACKNAYKLDQHARLKKAIKINEELAYRSISMGAFQILGLHCTILGYGSAITMYDEYSKSVDIMLDDFADFVLHSRLDDELRLLAFDLFAYGYNGAGYKANKYDMKLEAAYKKYKSLKK